jgi:hypothetical protein
MRESSIAFMPRNTFALLLDSTSTSEVSFGFSSSERLGDFSSMVRYERSLAPNASLAKSWRRCSMRCCSDDAFHRIEEELDWIEMASGQSSNRFPESIPGCYSAITWVAIVAVYKNVAA